MGTMVPGVTAVVVIPNVVEVAPAAVWYTAA